MSLDKALIPLSGQAYKVMKELGFRTDAEADMARIKNPHESPVRDIYRGDSYEFTLFVTKPYAATTYRAIQTKHSTTQADALRQMMEAILEDK